MFTGWSIFAGKYVIEYNPCQHKTGEKEETTIDKRSRLAAVAKNLAPLLAFFILYIVFFSAFGFGLPCIFRAITGLLCPGCGMSHALAAMIHGNFREAAEYNILSVTLLPALAIFFIIRLIRYINKGKEDFRVWEYVFLMACALVCAVFFLKRNNII